VLVPGEDRFRQFASARFDGEDYMSPRDFLDSLIQDVPRPRIKARLLSAKEVDDILKLTPSVSQRSSEDPAFFRKLGDDGLISFPEYLFLLSVLTRPRSGFRVAFDLIDVSRENVIEHDEFSQVLIDDLETLNQLRGSLQFVLMASAFRGVRYRSFPVRSTLKTHFFGQKGDKRLTYNDFYAFIISIDYLTKRHHELFY